MANTLAVFRLETRLLFRSYAYLLLSLPALLYVVLETGRRVVGWQSFALSLADWFSVLTPLGLYGYALSSFSRDRAPGLEDLLNLRLVKGTHYVFGKALAFLALTVFAWFAVLVVASVHRLAAGALRPSDASFAWHSFVLALPWPALAVALFFLINQLVVGRFAAAAPLCFVVATAGFWFRAPPRLEVLDLRMHGLLVSELAGLGELGRSLSANRAWLASLALLTLSLAVLVFERAGPRRVVLSRAPALAVVALMLVVGSYRAAMASPGIVPALALSRESWVARGVNRPESVYQPKVVGGSTIYARPESQGGLERWARSMAALEPNFSVFETPFIQNIVWRRTDRGLVALAPEDFATRPDPWKVRKSVWSYSIWLYPRRDGPPTEAEAMSWVHEWGCAEKVLGRAAVDAEVLLWDSVVNRSDARAREAHRKLATAGAVPAAYVVETLRKAIELRQRAPAVVSRSQAPC